MKKLYWNILISILIKFGCNGEIAGEDSETFYTELIKNSENLTTVGYEITHFNDKNVEVRNRLEKFQVQTFRAKVITYYLILLRLL